MSTSLRIPLLVAICLSYYSLSCADEKVQVAKEADLARKVRYILASKCFDCHGPDAARREAGLRLDQQASAQRKLPSGKTAIVPGKPRASELIARIAATDDSRMPPAESPKQLTAVERATLTRWVASGANWQTHWAYERPQPRPLPAVQRVDWVENPIDRFVLSQLEARGRSPNSSAARRTLIRRVTLDLTGLPPTREEVRQFLNDRSPKAYGRLVDRLLASPRYGERMAVPWLDAARFADTHGYLFDTARPMWRWRDWLIAALNRNMPFDQFTVEQLAGDLLPHATLAQKIATGFNRNHIINNEAGANPAEYFVENVIDRVNTTSTVWLGLSLACCQCHDHKYDPFTQKDYYRLYAYFNNVPEVGLDGLNANAKPFVAAPTPEQQLQLSRLQQQLAKANRAIAELRPQIDRAQRKWEDEQQSATPQTEPNGLLAHWPLDNSPEQLVSSDVASEFQGDKEKYTPGVLSQAISLSGLTYISAGSAHAFDENSKFTMAAWIRPKTVNGRMTIISRMLPANDGFRGYALQVVNGQVAMFLIDSFPDRMIQVQSKQKVTANKWTHLAVTYDGSKKAKGLTLWFNGQKQKTGLVVDKLGKTIACDAPFWIGNGHPGARWKGALDDIRIYDRPLMAEQLAKLNGLTIPSLLRIERSKRSSEAQRRIREHYLGKHAPPAWQSAFARIAEMQGKVGGFRRAIPTVMVMDELKKERPTRMLVRGAFDQPGKAVKPGLPAMLFPAAGKQPANRLDFAKWLVSPANPLTARVTVNRYWQAFFGTGLVRTSADFGVQGEAPSHPALLDWLAREFQNNGWNVKALHRLIVTSATYRQSSIKGAESWKWDPDNRWLSRGPSGRLPAETLRDQALAVAGLLESSLGGPSVKPYQPSGLWRDVAFDFGGANLTAQIYKQDRGRQLYRRTLYTFWKRTAPPPSLAILDAPDRERCVVRRQQTSTPLQALVLLNDPTYVEAARKLAERMMKAGDTPGEWINRGYQIVLARPARPQERELLQQLYEQQRQRLAGQPKSAIGLLKVGESTYDAKLSAHELAACTIVANVLLNLDETVSRR